MGAIIGITGIFPLLENNNDPRHFVMPDSAHRNFSAYSPTAIINLRGCFCISFQLSSANSKGSFNTSSLFAGACLGYTYITKQSLRKMPARASMSSNNISP